MKQIQLSIPNGRAAGPGDRVLIFVKRLTLEFLPGKNNDSNIKSSSCNCASLIKVLKKWHQTDRTGGKGVQIPRQLIAGDVTKGKFLDYLVPDTAWRKSKNFETK